MVFWYLFATSGIADINMIKIRFVISRYLIRVYNQTVNDFSFSAIGFFVLDMKYRSYLVRFGLQFQDSQKILESDAKQNAWRVFFLHDKESCPTVFGNLKIIIIVLHV